jgi:hypothetical protein
MCFCRSHYCISPVVFFNLFFYYYFRKSKSNMADLNNIEAEYIKNLQQQIYFLELESNYLYPLKHV